MLFWSWYSNSYSYGYCFFKWPYFFTSRDIFWVYRQGLLSLKIKFEEPHVLLVLKLLLHLLFGYLHHSPLPGLKFILLTHIYLSLFLFNLMKHNIDFLLKALISLSLLQLSLLYAILPELVWSITLLRLLLSTLIASYRSRSSKSFLSSRLRGDFMVNSILVKTSPKTLLHSVWFLIGLDQCLRHRTTVYLREDRLDLLMGNSLILIFAQYPSINQTWKEALIHVVHILFLGLFQLDLIMLNEWVFKLSLKLNLLSILINLPIRL